MFSKVNFSETVDPWWESYNRAQAYELEELRSLITELDEVWASSESPFHRDPLHGDWAETNPQSGPLRAQEENWSQWLAHLIRTSEGAFNRDLFGEKYSKRPEFVRREKAYQDEELHDRRVDILVEWHAMAISIEVKINDESYDKTPQTAYLTEKMDERNLDWWHLLLLPETKRSALKDVFGGQMTDTTDSHTTIRPRELEEQEINVLYWNEVSNALRGVLVSGSEPDLHWQASAYLFVTLIEEKILRLYPTAVVTEYLNAAIGVSDVDRLQSIDPDNQIQYLQDTLGVNYG